ncbi:hypothetical protein TA3x_001479 [Tundrisphaera sp. TA3]|uniref:hypothetical protein n=1 Tax=Tundrisphaera sp. TA3 TaxID=3435775 RepID=UPI003EC11618
MLNRTNRTLSANSTRLNLGTRSFALVANANIGNETLRHAHAAPHAAVRAGAVRYPVSIRFDIPPMADPKPLEPKMAKASGSSPLTSWPGSGQQAWAQVPLVADAFVVVRPVVDTVVSQPGRCVAPPVLSPSRLARLPLASCRRPEMGLAGRLARAAMVSDAAP